MGFGVVWAQGFALGSALCNPSCRLVLCTEHLHGWASNPIFSKWGFPATWEKQGRSSQSSEDS